MCSSSYPFTVHDAEIMDILTGMDSLAGDIRVTAHPNRTNNGS